VSVSSIAVTIVIWYHMLFLLLHCVLMLVLLPSDSPPMVKTVNKTNASGLFAWGQKNLAAPASKFHLQQSK